LKKKFNYRDVDFITNDQLGFNFNNKSTFTCSLLNTRNTSSNTTVTSSNNNITQDKNTYNYSRFEIRDIIDDRDFIYSKFGKFVNVESNGFIVRDVVKIPTNDYYQILNNKGNLVTFTSSYDTIESLGSGSGLISNQRTGSKYLKDYYRGINNSGYSKRHLSKFTFVGSKDKYQAVSSSKTDLINGIKLNSKGKVAYYTYIKGKNDVNTTVNREGITNGSRPVIVIPGFLSLNIETNASPAYGDTTGSVGNPDSLFVQLPLTASLFTSASLERYIMNL